MKRRTVLAGLGGLTAAGGLTIGSGAFTSVNAERVINIDTAQDSDALLKLDALGKAYRSSSGDQITFAFPSLEESETSQVNTQNPQGLGTDSIYRFASEAGSDEDGLFRAINQGTQDVRLWGSQPRTETGDGEKLPEVDIFDVSSGEVVTEDNPSKVLSPGQDTFIGGFRINTHGVDIRQKAYRFNIAIHAAVDKG